MLPPPVACVEGRQSYVPAESGDSCPVRRGGTAATVRCCGESYPVSVRGESVKTLRGAVARAAGTGSRPSRFPRWRIESPPVCRNEDFFGRRRGLARTAKFLARTLLLVRPSSRDSVAGGSPMGQRRRRVPAALGSALVLLTIAAAVLPAAAQTGRCYEAELPGSCSISGRFGTRRRSVQDLPGAQTLPRQGPSQAPCRWIPDWIPDQSAGGGGRRPPAGSCTLRVREGR